MSILEWTLPTRARDWPACGPECERILPDLYCGTERVVEGDLDARASRSEAWSSVWAVELRISLMVGISLAGLWIFSESGCEALVLVLRGGIDLAVLLLIWLVVLSWWLCRVESWSLAASAVWPIIFTGTLGISAVAALACVGFKMGFLIVSRSLLWSTRSGLFSSKRVGEEFVATGLRSELPLHSWLWLAACCALSFRPCGTLGWRSLGWLTASWIVLSARTD